MKKNVSLYYKFTKIFSIVWFALAILGTVLMFSYAVSGNFDVKNLVFKTFAAILLLITGLIFRDLGKVLKSIMERDAFDFAHLNRITTYIKVMMLCVVAFGFYLFENGIGPMMILILACLAFVLIIFNLFPIYREMR
ncbi:MAG: hypothetical protein SPI65_02705 [Peptoniphilus sp.]|nr:hypothetical protein [Peptoniphilus sp.]MDY6044471.1 hypothetical protein [Peptoniphilus sp.]